MVNRQGQNALKRFLESPSKESEQLLDVPHAYQLLRFDRQQNGGHKYSACVLSVCQWLLNRSITVLAELLRNSPPALEAAGFLPGGTGDDWETVRTLFVLFACLSDRLCSR